MVERSEQQLNWLPSGKRRSKEAKIKGSKFDEVFSRLEALFYVTNTRDLSFCRMHKIL